MFVGLRLKTSISCCELHIKLKTKKSFGGAPDDHICTGLPLATVKTSAEGPEEILCTSGQSLNVSPQSSVSRLTLHLCLASCSTGAANPFRGDVRSVALTPSRL